MRLLLLALALLPSLSRAQSSATLRGVDVYRSATLIEAHVEALRPRLVLYTELRDSRRKANQQAASRLKKEILDKLSAHGDYAFIDLYYGQYVTSVDHAAHITVDVVDKADAPSRMPFRAAPVGRVPDPDGLLAAWDQYIEAGQRARREGAAAYDRPDCPAFFCLYGSQTPELAAFERRFVEGAKQHRQALSAVLDREASPRRRAAAVYLASYLPEGPEVAGLMLKALQDPDAQVRGAALEVLSDLATYHREVALDPKPLLAALDYPVVTDRARALGVFVGLSDSPEQQEFVRKNAGRPLLRLLKQTQPSVHDLAFTILSIVSKESFGRRDYDAWSRWVEAQAVPDGR